MKTMVDPLPSYEPLLLNALDHNTAAGVKLCEYSDGCRIVYVNDGFAELTGYTKDELMGSDYELVICPDDKPGLVQEIETQCESSGHFSMTYPIKRKDGTPLWVLDCGIVVRQKDGMAFIQSTVIDVSSYKKTEAALKISQRRNEIALSFSDVTVFEYNVKTKQILTQDSDFDSFHMPGIIENGIETVIDSGIFAERSKDEIRRLYREIDEGAASSTAVVYANDTNGSERTLELQLISIFDTEGNPVHALGVRKDITESLLFHKEKEYSSQLAAERLFIYEANVTQNKTVYFSPTWARDAGITPTLVFSNLVSLVCEACIAPEDCALFAEKQSQAFLLEAFGNGERLTTFEYRRLIPEKGYLWFEAKINIIQDEFTKDISIRVHTLNIDDKKKSEIQAAAQQRHYELTLSKSAIIYELNITKDTFILGHDKLQKNLGLITAPHNVLGNLPQILARVHSQDRAAVATFLSYSNIKQAYELGTTSSEIEYQLLTSANLYRWFRCSLQLFKDASSGDLMCYAYIEDIDKKKRKDLTLLYNAQRDLMTSFYNKKTTEEKIDAFLASSYGSEATHVFFIVDLDYFKQVNDKFGHAFGDAVISQAAARIKELFRTGDILGRVGGDEFVVFMKNVRNKRIAFLKAQEICSVLSETYTQAGIEYTMTASVGIAFFSEHGKTYNELYRHSDTALYNAKENGRGQFSLYHEAMQLNHASSTSIDKRQVGEVHTFENNLSEYVFRILYESEDKQRAINSVLELIGKHYHLSRAYVFENCEDEEGFALNTFEWCDKGVELRKEDEKKISYEGLDDYAANFSDEGIFCPTASETGSAAVSSLLKRQNIKDALQFSMMKNGKFSGFIGFDECARHREFEVEELNDYRNFSNILGVFINEMRTLEQVESAKNVTLSIVNGLDSYAYVCDPVTYQLLFVNDKTSKNIPAARVGQSCHKALWNNDDPCADCPMVTLDKNKQSSCIEIRYNPVLDGWFKVSASWLDWINNEKGCLITCIDISEFMSNSKK